MRKLIISAAITSLLFSVSPVTEAASLSAFMMQEAAGTKIIDGKKFKMHKVAAKQTWTSIAKQYKITIKELQDANSGINMLKTGQIIMIPVIDNATKSADSKAAPANTAEKPDPTEAKSETKKIKTPIYHTVKKGETLYAISRESKSDVKDLKEWNNISGSNIKVGSKLIVGYEEKDVKTTVKQNPVSDAALVKSTTNESDVKTPPASTTDEIKPPAAEVKLSTQPPVEPQVKKEYLKESETGKKVNQITETGEAAWVNDADLNPNKYYALHRTAPIGTIAKITNKMNGKSVFVKVIGRLPNTGDNFNVLIKVSKASADKIGVIDEHFVAEISYAMAEE